ncbi:hypothetical protein B9Z55_025256 [Caenorhabditis nigoni]|nr:hypothetical protein B9Z55_025256 [Caenorhabditis nigoni]
MMRYDIHTLLVAVRNHLVQIQENSAPAHVIKQSGIYPAVFTEADISSFLINFTLQDQLYKSEEYGYHPKKAEEDPSFNLDELIVNPFKFGELPVLSLPCGIFGSRESDNDVIKIIRNGAESKGDVKLSAKIRKSF